MRRPGGGGDLKTAMSGVGGGSQMGGGGDLKTAMSGVGGGQSNMMTAMAPPPGSQMGALSSCSATKLNT